MTVALTVFSQASVSGRRPIVRIISGNSATSGCFGVSRIILTSQSHCRNLSATVSRIALSFPTEFGENCSARCIIKTLFFTNHYSLITIHSKKTPPFRYPLRGRCRAPSRRDKPAVADRRQRVPAGNCAYGSRRALYSAAA